MTPANSARQRSRRTTYSGTLTAVPRWRGTAIATIGAILLTFPIADRSTAQPDPSATQADAAQLAREQLSKEAMVFHFRQTRDHGLLTEQLYAVKLFREGLAPNDIVRRTMAKRREWAATRLAGIDGEWHASEYGKTVARLVGRSASQLLGAGSGGVELANEAIRSYENWMRGGKVSRAAQRLTEDFSDWQDSIGRSEEAVFDLTRQTYERDGTFRAEVWDVLFLNQYGFRPDSPAETVLDNYPDFTNHETIRAISEGLGAQERVLNLTLDVQRQGVDELGDIRMDLANLRDLAPRFREVWAAEEGRKNKERQDQIRAIELAGQRSAVNIAATFIGFDNPELGRQIRATSDAMFRAREALKVYGDALKVGASDSAAGLILAGDYLSLGLTLVGAFIDTGPSADQIILEGIGALREEVQELRREMHERFDQIYDTLVKGFDALFEYNRGIIDRLDLIETQLRSARSQLGELTGIQLDTQVVLIQQAELLADLNIGLETAVCAREDGYLPGGMTAREFQECRAEYEALAPYVPRFQLEALGARTTVAEWLRARPDRTISWSLEEFRRLLIDTGSEGPARANALPESVVGPEAWFYVTDLHHKFLAAHPVHAANFAEDIANSQFVQIMKGHRLDLVRFAEEIRNELAAFQDRSRPTVFSKLLEEAWATRVQERMAEWSRRSSGDYGDEDLRGLERDMAIRNAHVRSWIGLAFHDSIPRSYVVQQIMAGQVRLPDRLADWPRPPRLVVRDGAGQPLPIPPLTGLMEVENVVRRRRGQLEETLRSVAMRDVVEYGFGHSIVTETDFANLGDVRE